MYKYEDLRPDLFTDDGQRLFLHVRYHVQKTLQIAGAIRMQEAIRVQGGDTWRLLACVDRMVELGELREIPQTNVAGQHRIFVA